MNEKISHFNGFLSCIAILDTITNCGMCDYFIKPIEYKGSIDATLKHHYASYFIWLNSQEKPNSPTHQIQYTKLDEWERTLIQTIEEWSLNSETSAIQLNTNPKKSEFINFFLEQLKALFSGAIDVWEVLNGSNDVYFREYVFRDSHQYFLLHFGLND
ncbi:MAG: hypothetical protein ACKOXD_07115 [Acinetobacter sp.]